jgi:hypothetical protein
VVAIVSACNTIINLKLISFNILAINPSKSKEHRPSTSKKKKHVSDDVVKNSPSDITANDLPTNKYVQNPNILLVDESISDDHFIVTINPNKMEELGLFNGDTVQLTGKKKRETVGIINSDNTVPHSKVKLTKMTRSNIRYDTIEYM